MAGSGNDLIDPAECDAASPCGGITCIDEDRPQCSSYCEAYGSACAMGPDCRLHWAQAGDCTAASPGGGGVCMLPE